MSVVHQRQARDILYAFSPCEAVKVDYADRHNNRHRSTNKIPLMLIKVPVHDSEV